MRSILTFTHLLLPYTLQMIAEIANPSIYKAVKQPSVLLTYHFQVQAIYTDQLITILARIHTPVKILIYQRQTYLYLCLWLHTREIEKAV